ncbi:MAG: phosphoadenylyl-sulfate reductase [Candidatus Bathyarchaeota archaeon]|nr:MAG: phosphoadenylyl-sulfate reductase [Candidatus Bathyarchaeota archaeon]
MSLIFDPVTINKSLEGKTPNYVLEWAIRRFHPRIAIASSFSVEDTIVIDMATKIQPDIKVFYINTGFQFKETDEIKDILKKKYQLNLVEYSSKLSMEEQTLKYGENLYKKDANLCCQLRKVEPIKRALKELDAWITGLRRGQAVTRNNLDIVQINKLDNQTSLVKVNPLINWTRQQVWSYIEDNEIPYNPLYDKNYASIGCEPCTRPVQPGEDERAGRWAGTNKKECGIHTFSEKPKNSTINAR